MIDLISHEEPAIHEVDHSPSRGVETPYLAWFLTAMVLQVVVIIGLAASKALATAPSETNVKISTSTYVHIHHDKFRGNYINGFTVRADESLPAPLKSKRIPQSLNASIDTAPFFVSEKLSDKISLMQSTRKPIEFELRVADSGETRILSVEN